MTWRSLSYCLPTQHNRQTANCIHLYYFLTLQKLSVKVSNDVTKCERHNLQCKYKVNEWTHCNLFVLYCRSDKSIDRLFRRILDKGTVWVVQVPYNIPFYLFIIFCTNCWKTVSLPTRFCFSHIPSLEKSMPPRTIL